MSKRWLGLDRNASEDSIGDGHPFALISNLFAGRDGPEVVGMHVLFTLVLDVDALYLLPHHSFLVVVVVGLEVGPCLGEGLLDVLGTPCGEPLSHPCALLPRTACLLRLEQSLEVIEFLLFCVSQNVVL